MAGFVDKIKRMWDSPDDEYEYDDYSYEDNNKDSYDDEDSYEEQREHQREVRRSERSERRRYTLTHIQIVTVATRLLTLMQVQKFRLFYLSLSVLVTKQEVLQMKSTRIAL